jgi:uncharacterized protein YllA (UPF0747 family)
MSVGYDLTEQEFDLENARVTAEIKSDPDFNDSLFTQYASKDCPTEKGYWMQLVEGYEKYFINSEYPLVPYIPLTEETYEV